MDCPSEESLIRMKLGELDRIHSMEFDIPSRKLIVYHEITQNKVLTNLESLNLGAMLISSDSSEDFQIPENQTQDKKLLLIVLGINFFFFCLESLFGFLFHSLGLVADGLDMLADSLVYGMALMVVGKSYQKKNRVAALSGYLQLILALLGLIEVIRRFIGVENMPDFQVMIAISIFALLGNSLSLYIIQKSKSKESHMQASYIFTSNDIIANLGVVLAGTLVYYFESGIPDLIIGFLVFGLVAFGAFRILKFSKTQAH